MRIINDFYTLRPFQQIIIVLILLLFWSMVLISFREKELKRIGTAGFFLSVAAILYLTLFRDRSGSGELILDPLHNFREARRVVELYRSLLVNVFLFMPIGMTMPLLFPQRMKCIHICVLTVLTAFAVSLGIEAAQYFFTLGQAASDDVICNTLGALVGAVPFIIMRASLKRDMKDNPPSSD